MCNSYDAEQILLPATLAEQILLAEQELEQIFMYVSSHVRPFYLTLDG